MQDNKDDLIKLKMEIATIIMGYEKELSKEKREDISEFSKGCMERYFQIINEIKEDKNADV